MLLAALQPVRDGEDGGLETSGPKVLTFRSISSKMKLLNKLGVNCVSVSWYFMGATHTTVIHQHTLKSYSVTNEKWKWCFWNLMIFREIMEQSRLLNSSSLKEKLLLGSN